jgi:hypothetical protein
MRFYQEGFARESEKREGPSDYWLLAAGEVDLGINGGISQRRAAKPSLPKCLSRALDTRGTSKNSVAIAFPTTVSTRGSLA